MTKQLSSYSFNEVPILSFGSLDFKEDIKEEGSYSCKDLEFIITLTGKRDDIINKVKKYANSQGFSIKLKRGDRKVMGY